MQSPERVAKYERCPPRTAIDRAAARINLRMEQAGCFNLETEKDMVVLGQMGVTSHSPHLLPLYRVVAEAATHALTKPFTEWGLEALGHIVSEQEDALTARMESGQ